MKNRVAKLVEIGKIEVYEESYDPDEIKEGFLSVKLTRVGICGSDIHYFKEGGLGSFKNPLPMDIGHEPAGRVINSRSKKFKDGDYIAIEPGRVCLDCNFCHQGKHNMCSNVMFMGANAPGAFRDYITIHESQAFKVTNQNPGVHDRFTSHIALYEPLGVAIHAFNRMDKQYFGKSLAIFGAGPIGLSLLRVAKRLGFKEVIVLDNLQYRLRVAEELGADRTFASDSEAVEYIKRYCGGVDYVLDAAGFQSVIDKSTAIVKPGGTIGLVGIPEVDNLTYNPHQLRIKEVNIINVRRSNQTLQACDDMFKDDYVFMYKVASHTDNIESIQQAFERVASYSDNVIKGMISFN